VNSIVQEQFPILEQYQALRDQLMEMLSDQELEFSPGGENPTLGAVCRDMGDVEHAYVESFKTFTQDFSYRNEEPGLERSVEGLTAWFKTLDRDLRAAVEALSEDDVQNKVIDRGSGFEVSPSIQLHIYREALIIFYGKVSVYLKTMGKPRPQQWQDWIG
jgi:uncharacterized damage-inducible protein DinB